MVVTSLMKQMCGLTKPMHYYYSMKLRKSGGHGSKDVASKFGTGTVPGNGGLKNYPDFTHIYLLSYERLSGVKGPRAAWVGGRWEGMTSFRISR